MLRQRRFKCPVGVGFTPQGKARILRCGRWSCRYCRRTLANKWAQRAQREIHQRTLSGADTYWMITLTLGRKFKTAYQGYVQLPRLWDTLRKSMLRRWGTWRYMAFVEGQENRGGMPHFHILSNRLPSAENGRSGRPTKRTLHDWAVRLGWGFEIDVSQIQGRKAAEYVSKYASKATGQVPKGFRRVRVNRSWARGVSDRAGRLIVPARGEAIADFIARVSNETGVDPFTLYGIWTKSWEEVYNSQVM